MQIISNVKFTWSAEKFTRALKTEVNNRVQRVCEHLRTKVIENVSQGQSPVEAPSAPGNYPRAVSGDIIRRMFVQLDKTNFSGIVGTNSPHGLWQEVGTTGADMRPTKKKAMTIPISAADAARIMESVRRPGKGGRRIKKGNSNRALMRRAGIVTIAGRLYLLRTFARRKPILQRSFLRRTLSEEQDAIMRIMATPLGKGVAPGAVSVSAQFPANLPSGPDYEI